MLGAAVSPLVSYEGFFLQGSLHLTLGARTAFFAGAWSFALPALWWFGRRGEAAFRTAPRHLVELASLAMAILTVGLVIAVVPVVWVSLIGFGLVFAAASVAAAFLTASLFSLVRPRARPLAGALSGLFFALIGGEAGTLLLGGIDTEFSTTAAILVLVGPAALSAFLLRRASRDVDGDLDRVIDEVVEDEVIRTVTASGAHLPMLACRGLDFSYGQLQVLFGVDFSVDDGELVALLGVNGAGKSTLLRVISGIGIPSSGSVRFRGSDITYLDAERRLHLGITQVPGGRAVFGAMTVVENLRGMGYTLGKDTRHLNAALDTCFETFPSLAKRRNQTASTLSGGEQQMLALSKALILRPKLLVIDELSLGLAPMIVGQLLELVKRLNKEGMAIVLVEQSVSIALNLAEHAYFMEKGMMRFNGSSQSLLDRTDLLRAVFLGATDVSEFGE